MRVHLVQLAMAVLAFALLFVRPRGEKLVRLVSLAIIADALRWRVMRAALWRTIRRPSLGVRWRAFRHAVARSWRGVAIGLLATCGVIAFAAVLLVHHVMTPDLVANPTARDYPLAVGLIAYVLSILCTVTGWFGWKVWRVVRSARALPSSILSWRTRRRVAVRTVSRVIAAVVLLVLVFRHDHLTGFARDSVAEFGPMLRQAVIASAYAEVVRDRPSPCPGYPLTEDDLVRPHGDGTADVIVMRYIAVHPHSWTLEQVGVVRNVTCHSPTVGPASTVYPLAREFPAYQPSRAPVR